MIRFCATQAAGPQTKTALAQFEVGGFDFQNQTLNFRAKAAEGGEPVETRGPGFAIELIFNMWNSLTFKFKTARLFLIRNVRFFEAVLAFHSEVEKAIASSGTKRNTL